MPPAISSGQRQKSAGTGSAFFGAAGFRATLMPSSFSFAAFLTYAVSSRAEAGPSIDLIFPKCPMASSVVSSSTRLALPESERAVLLERRHAAHHLAADSRNAGSSTSSSLRRRGRRRARSCGGAAGSASRSPRTLRCIDRRAGRSSASRLSGVTEVYPAADGTTTRAPWDPCYPCYPRRVLQRVRGACAESEQWLLTAKCDRYSLDRIEPKTPKTATRGNQRRDVRATGRIRIIR